jgi:tetratricopeptide (TPR) repeat protein/predicted Ser/Thr protein kinase
VERPCLDEATVLAFIDGTLGDELRNAVETHIALCADCAEVAVWAAAEVVEGKRALGLPANILVGQFPPGTRVDRYQLLGMVGRGNMGEVYAAYHPDLDRRIALKVLRELDVGSPERRARLSREARAIARLSHPNVISVFDAGTFEGRVYIAMEFIDGVTLDAWLAASNRTWREVVDVFVAAGRGLAAAHGAGIVHRDFKPQNIMIARDGTARVMDFGLARLLEEDAGPDRDGEQPITGQDVFGRVPANVTMTGALVGTPAYMAPEQFHGRSIDARADQFSFCVALHEALHGRRPRLPHLPVASGEAESSSSAARAAQATAARGGSRRSGPPAWLKSIIARGLSPDRERRFGSMDQLLRALARGRARVRRASLAMAALLALALVASLARFGRVGQAITCRLPKDRLAAVWMPTDETDPRRAAIHRAFVATGWPMAETAWQRVSRAIDDHIRAWANMYAEACAATHVRGEQSGEVLDLRMACLAENLDEARALTGVLMTADATTVAHAVTAAQALTPVDRCANVSLLRSPVPLPRDDATLQAVRRLEQALRDLRVLHDLTFFRAASAQAAKLRPEVERTGYKPLLGQLLELMGTANFDSPRNAKVLLEEALYAAESGRDDVTAARAASTLIAVTGYGLDRPEEGWFWARLCNAILDRLGPEAQRIRAWAVNNEGMLLAQQGDFQEARRRFDRAVQLKEQALGRDHPDVAISIGNRSEIEKALGLLQPALADAERAIQIFSEHGDPNAAALARAHDARADVLVELGRYSEAAAAYRRGLAILRTDSEDTHPDEATALNGLGVATLGEGRPEEAIPLIERALTMRQQREIDATLVAETRFSLARALWAGGGDRRRARSLALAAREAFVAKGRAQRVSELEGWLGTHKLRDDRHRAAGAVSR